MLQVLSNISIQLQFPDGSSVAMLRSGSSKLFGNSVTVYQE